MGQCPSRNDKESADSIFAKDVTEAQTQPLQKVRPTPQVAAKKFRADAQSFVPREDADSYFDDDDKTSLMPWERFLEDKKKEVYRPPGRFNRDNAGAYTSSYRQLLQKSASNSKWPKENRNAAWSKNAPGTFDPVESWRTMPNKKPEIQAPASKKKKQTPLKKAILQHSAGAGECMFAKFQEHLNKAQTNTKDDGSISKIAEQIEKLEKRAAADDIALKSDLVPFGLSDRHYFSAEEDTVKSNKHTETSQVVPREYVSMTMSSALESSVTALLYKLRHLKVAELTCGTESKRYAVGLREVARLLRGDQAAALIVAPDVERNSGGMLEQKIAGLVETCKNNGIPVIYALSRRQLGHAVMKNVAISVMLVQSTRGAEQEYASMIEEAKAAQKNWDQTNKKRAPPGL